MEVLRGDTTPYMTMVLKERDMGSKSAPKWYGTNTEVTEKTRKIYPFIYFIYVYHTKLSRNDESYKYTLGRNMLPFS